MLVYLRFVLLSFIFDYIGDEGHYAAETVMKKLFIGIVLIMGLLIGAILILPGLVPASAYKEKIESQLAIALGRDVTITGDVKLSVFPVLKAQTGAIEIDNADGFEADYFITMDGLDARIRLMPLFSKQVEVAKFELTKPIINLEKKADGSDNWTIGAPKAETAPAETEPFKRDGRFNDYDPKIGQFDITDGQIIYRDRLAGVSHDITGASLSFSLPSLDEVVEIDGAMILNGTPINLDVLLDTPRYFLGGGVANFTAKLETEFANFDAKGQFAESADMAFRANIDGNIRDMDALTALVPQEIKYAELLNSGSFSGDLSYDGNILTAVKSDIAVNGDLFEAAYNGDAKINLSEPDVAPIFSGRVSADVNNVPALLTAVEQSIDGAELVKTANVTADLTAQDNGFLARNIVAKISGDNLNGSYEGQADIGDVITAQGDFTASIQQLPAAVKALKLEIEQDVVIDTAELAGGLTYREDAIDVTLSRADVNGGLLSAAYQGDVKLRGKDVSAKGQFTADAQQVPALLRALKIDVKQAGILDRVKASGDIDYSADVVKLNLGEAQLNSPDLIAAYQGTVEKVGDVVGATGVLSQLDIPSVPTLSQKAGVENKAVTMLGRVALAAPLNVSYDGTRAQLNNINLNLTNGALNGGYTGTLTHILGDKPQTALKGNFKAEGQSLRRAAQAFDIALPASTAQGAIFESFAVNGVIDGDLNAMTLSLTNSNIDQLAANGQFTARLSGAKPNVTGQLNIDTLDIRPYQAAYAPPANAPKTKGWSKEPLNVSAIKNFDADISLTTQKLLTSSVSFGPSTVQTVIKDSKLTIDFPNMAIYGGKGRMLMSIDARRRDPVLDMDLSLASLDTESILAKFVSFANATGIGATNFKIRGAGLSMDSIIKSLNGGGEFGVRDGQVQGIDMVSTLNGFTQGLSLQSAVSGLGADKVTTFEDIIGKFSIKNGVMSIDDFNFNALGLVAEGGGQVDIGNQNIDFRFKPRLTTQSANSIARNGIPLRISGDFSNLKTGLDQSAVQSILASQAQSFIQDNVGGSAGAILGSVLGGSQSSNSGAGSSQGSVTPDVGSVLGSILGSQSNQQAPASGSNTSPQAPAKKQEEVQPEDLARDLLGGLFGSKKKNKKDDDK